MRHRSLADARRRFFAYQERENHSPKRLAHDRQAFADFDRFLAATRRAACVAVLTSEVLQEFVAWLKATPRRLYRGSTQRSLVGIAGHMKDLRPSSLRYVSQAPEDISAKRAAASPFGRLLAQPPQEEPVKRRRMLRRGRSQQWAEPRSVRGSRQRRVCVLSSV